jgi:Tripartite tricarboxylate transporter TctB family
MKRNPKDFWTGLLYIFLGASAVIIARDYSILGAVLAVIGAISVIRSFVAPGTPIGGFTFKGLALIVISVVIFGLLVRDAGLVVALPLLVILSACASAHFRWRTAIIMAAGLTLFCAVVFVKGLGIPLPIIGPWLAG